MLQGDIKIVVKPAIYYFVFVNRVNVWSDRVFGSLGNPDNPPNRYWADNLSYDLYQKPNATNQINWKNIYTLLTSSYNPNNNVTNCAACDKSTPYSRGSGKWLTTVNVAVTNGTASFEFPDGGTTMYYKNPEDRIGEGFYTASLINGGWIP